MDKRKVWAWAVGLVLGVAFMVKLAVTEISSTVVDGLSAESEEWAPSLQLKVIEGEACPDFLYETVDGQKVSLADFRGKALIIDVFSPT